MIIVAYDDKVRKVYPPAETSKWLPHDTHNHRLKLKKCQSAKYAKWFYLKKFWEYHEGIKSELIGG